MQNRNLKFVLIIFILITTLFISCGEDSKKKEAPQKEVPEPLKETVFKLLSPDKTNISFANNIKENPQASILNYQYFYNGGGVAVGDVNNDGLEDLYFSGNIVPNRLYLNKGNMEFEDVTAQAGVLGRKGNWKTGVSMADVNGDGKLDIYLCYSGDMDGKYRTNQLFINQGTDEKGIPLFKDLAPDYGLADSAFSTHAVFFDFDLDGDLDMFLLNHNPYMYESLDEIGINEILKEPSPMMRVKLYRHDQKKDGSPTFVDISDKAGLPKSAFTYGLGAGIADINKDGYPDIYISNDYSAPDFLFINNKNGTFTDQLEKSMGHISLYSMGNDIADINNDGLPDIFVLDMLPEGNRRQKLLLSPDNYEQFDMYLGVGFHHQYMRNMLHVNTGLVDDKTPVFSEIGQIAGISNTDWSWAPLFADFDNDGWKDLFVSNGFLKDLTNLDFIKFSNNYISQFPKGAMRPEHFMNVLSKMPSTNLTNYLYRNNGNLTFEDKSASWGMDLPSNSNGAAYADLDNDGDLDLIINNINEPAFIYENTSSSKTGHNYLKVKLEGEDKNLAGIGAKITVYIKDKKQYQEQMPNRGYQSSVSPILHFGLGEEDTVDSLMVVWQKGKVQVLKDITANQTLALQEKNAGPSNRKKQPSTTPIFREIAPPIAFEHSKSAVNDFKRQPLLINPLSFSGPCMVKADINGDGLEDIFVGGNSGQAGAIYLQQKNGSFVRKDNEAFQKDNLSEDTDALFFDVNNDGALDLYVCSGGYGNYLPEDPLLQDRIYINDGKGNFSKLDGGLPKMLTSSSCVRASDINNDGFIDLFVGSRVIPGRYPEIPKSYILMNQEGRGFEDMTSEVAPELEKVGLVTDAIWYDFNDDETEELLIIGEWMPVTVFTLENKKLMENTSQFFDQKYRGWWNKLVIEDFNKDGKADLLIGNMGLNSQVKASDSQPAELYYKDFDDNGSIDPILCFYINGISYPYVTRDELLDQISIMRRRFSSYESYANAGIHDIFTIEEMKGAKKLTATTLETMYFTGGEGGKFTKRKLPLEVQFSPAFSFSALDYNSDGFKDLIIGGNINQARLRFGKHDANFGTLLKNDGHGNFTYVSQNHSGFHVNGDVRSILRLENVVLFGINGGEIKAYQKIGDSGDISNNKMAIIFDK